VNTGEKTNLLDLNRAGMEAYFVDLGTKAFHGRNVLKWIHKHGVTDFDAMTDVPKKLRAELNLCAEVCLPEIILEHKRPGDAGSVISQLLLQ